MPSLMEISDELVPLTRHEVPKRRLNNKTFHRYRGIWKNDGTVYKIIVVEGANPNDFPMKQQDDIFDNVTRAMSSDYSGMSHFMVEYSLGKQKRWELAKKTAADLPDPQEAIASLSVLKFYKSRTDFASLKMFGGEQGSVHAFYGENPYHRQQSCDFHEYSISTGEQSLCRRGKFNNKQKVLEPSPEVTEMRVHVQYHVTEYKLNKKVHNSERYRIWHDSRDQYCKPLVEGCRLNCDVIKLANGSYVTAKWEFNGPNVVQDNAEELEESEVELPKAPGITFADFLVPKVKRQRRRRNTSEQWVFI